MTSTVSQPTRIHRPSDKWERRRLYRNTRHETAPHEENQRVTDNRQQNKVSRLRLAVRTRVRAARSYHCLGHTVTKYSQPQNVWVVLLRTLVPLAAITPAARRRLRLRTQNSFVRNHRDQTRTKKTDHNQGPSSRADCRATEVYKGKADWCAAYRRTPHDHQNIKGAQSTVTRSTQRQAREQTRSEKKTTRNRTRKTKCKEQQRDLQHLVEGCIAHGVPGTSDRQPSKLRLKSTGGLTLLGLVPASSRVGRPAGGGPHNTEAHRAPDGSS